MTTTEMAKMATGAEASLFLVFFLAAVFPMTTAGSKSNENLELLRDVKDYYEKDIMNMLKTIEKDRQSIVSQLAAFTLPPNDDEESQPETAKRKRKGYGVLVQAVEPETPKPVSVKRNWLDKVRSEKRAGDESGAERKKGAGLRTEEEEGQKEEEEGEEHPVVEVDTEAAADDDGDGFDGIGIGIPMERTWVMVVLKVVTKFMKAIISFLN